MKCDERPSDGRKTDPIACLGPLLEQMSSTLELSEIYRRVAEQAGELVDYDGFAILLLNDAAQAMIDRAARMRRGRPSN